MRACTGAVLVLGLASAAFAQIQKPRLDLTPSVAPAAVAPGTKVTMSLQVRMPKDIHIQSDKPHDASVIATTLTVEPPAGITVDRVTFPAATPLAQAGRAKPLAVLGPDLTIEVQLSVAPTVAAGSVRIPGQLRYQACDDRVCFAPARAAVTWELTVASR